MISNGLELNAFLCCQSLIELPHQTIWINSLQLSERKRADGGVVYAQRRALQSFPPPRRRLLPNTQTRKTGNDGRRAEIRVQISVHQRREGGAVGPRGRRKRRNEGVRPGYGHRGSLLGPTPAAALPHRSGLLFFVRAGKRRRLVVSREPHEVVTRVSPARDVKDNVPMPSASAKEQRPWEKKKRS